MAFMVDFLAKACHKIIVFMTRSLLRSIGFVAFSLFALPGALLAQAAVEYALKSGSSVVSHIEGSRVAGCKVDSSLVVCLSRSYPMAAVLIGATICVFIVRRIVRLTGYRTR